MTTTDRILPAPPRPDYRVPLTLREALDAGEDFNEANILDELGHVLAGGEIDRRLLPYRSHVRAALDGDERSCIPFKTPDCGEGEYRLTWPRQDMIDDWQWIADLNDEPELAPLVLERLNDENRAYVEDGVRITRQINQWQETMASVTDDQLVAGATDLAAWLAVEAASTPGREMFTGLGQNLLAAVEGGKVDKLREWFHECEVD